MILDLPRLFLGVGFGVGLGFAAAGTSAGCSSSSASSVPAPVEGNACPATVDTTVGATCASQGLVCSPTFPCGLATVTVHCMCEEGTFQCIDGSGNSFVAGSTPSCGEAAPPPMVCPATESAATTAACAVGENGQQCAYPPECPGATLAFDRCTCQPRPDGSGFSYDCQNACNGGNEPLPEAGASSGGVDGARDSPVGEGAAPAGDSALQGDIAAE